MGRARIRRFRHVDLWPAQIPSRLLVPHSDAELFRKRSVAVAALYSRHLGEGPPVMATVWGARIHVQDDPVPPTGSPWGEEPPNDIGTDECCHVQVDRRLLGLPDRARRRAMLDWIHVRLVDLARHRGWPAEPFERARSLSLDDDLRFVETGRTVHSPDRRSRATAEFEIDGNGDGWSTVRIENRAGEPIHTAGPWDSPINAFSGRALRSVRWTSSHSLRFTPWPDPVAWHTTLPPGQPVEIALPGRVPSARCG